ncbi:metal ABC transporter permease, partial [Pantoea eucrina]
LLFIAMLLAIAAALSGLMLSWYYSLPAGPAVVLSAAGLFLLSVLTGPCGGVLRRR